MSIGKLAMVTILLLLIVVTIASQVRGDKGEVLEVCPECEYKTISDALRNIKPGSIVYIRRGEYIDRICINNTEGIRLELDNGTIVSQANNSKVLLVVANSSNISIICKGCCVFRGERKAILVVNSHNISIVNINLTDSFQWHLELKNSTITLKLLVFF